MPPPFVVTSVNHPISERTEASVLINLKQAAEATGLSPEKLRKLMSDGTLVPHPSSAPAANGRRTVRFDLAALRKWRKEHKDALNTPPTGGVTLKEAAVLMGMSYKSAVTKCQRNIIKSTKVGRRVFVSREEINRQQKMMMVDLAPSEERVFRRVSAGSVSVEESGSVVLFETARKVEELQTSVGRLQVLPDFASAIATDIDTINKRLEDLQPPTELLARLLAKLEVIVKALE